MSDGRAGKGEGRGGDEREVLDGKGGGEEEERNDDDLSGEVRRSTRRGNGVSGEEQAQERKKKESAPLSPYSVLHSPSYQTSRSSGGVEQNWPSEDGREGEEVECLREVDRSDVHLFVA